MKKTLLFILFIIILISCTQQENSYKKNILGRWNNFPLGLQNDYQFYNDSVISNVWWHTSKGTWKINDSKIFLHFPSDAKNPEWNEFLEWKYQLSHSKDSLFITFSIDTITIKTLLFKVNNHWKHHLKSFDLQIELPTTTKKLIKTSSNHYPNFYLAKKDNKLIVKSALNKTLSSRDFTAFFYNEISMHPKEFTLNQVNLIIDKNVPQTDIDSVKKIIQKTGIANFKFFRVYKSDVENYGYLPPNYNSYLNQDYLQWNWRGLFD